MIVAAVIHYEVLITASHLKDMYIKLKIQLKQ